MVPMSYGESCHEAYQSDNAGVQEEIQSDSAELSQATAVLVENVPEKLSREVLGMMVQSICYVTEEEFSVEMIRDMNIAVVTFSQPSAAERFLSKCSGHSRFQQYLLQGRVLEPTCSVRVENLPPQAEEDLLELYFENERQGGGRVAGITMIPEEQAAIITFQHSKVAENVLQRKHHICKALVSVYPYQPALGTALYGTDRPEWKLPEAFTENLHPALGNFLLQESQLAAISAQMQAQFCQVEFNTEHAKLRPLPGLLKQKGLTANRIEGWRGEASQAFHSIVARYRCFECPVSASVWKAAETEIRQAVSEDAVLLPNLPNGVVAIAGLAKDVDRIQKEMEEMVQRVANQLERETKGVSEEMVVSPGMHSILQQAGLQSVFTQTYPALSITYWSDTQSLVLSGLPTEVIMVKSWVLAKKLEMNQRPLDLEPDLLGFLSTANSEEISQKLFTSCGVSAVYKMENKGLVLVGASEEALSKADRLLKEALAFQSVEVEDEAVLRKQEWAKLKRQLMEANNSSGQSTVSIQLSHQGCVTVTGFRKAVQDVADSLSRFINQHSCVEEAVPVRTTAILIFLQEHKATDWRQRADAEEVSVRFQDKKPQVVLRGARFRVQGLKRLFAQLDAALYTDRLKIIKPGARKYFLEKKQMFSFMMKEKKCVVVLQEEGEQEEEEGEEPMTQAMKTVVADVQHEEWDEKRGSSADQSRYKPSESKGELEALHTKEGLVIVLRKGNIQDASVSKVSGKLGHLEEKLSNIFSLGGGETKKEEEFVLEGEEFSPTVFQFCGESVQAVAAAKEELKSLLVKEQLERTLREPAIALLGLRQRLALQDLQKRLTVRIQLESRGGPSFLHLEGLSRDVLTAESEIRQMIREVEVAENQRREAALLSDLVEWQYEDGGIFVPFDSLTNLKLENAFHKKSSLKININNSEYKTDLARNKVFGRGREVALKRIYLKEALPGTWDSMGGSALQTVALRQGSKEYQDVEAQFRRSGLTNSIVEIVRIQNEALWKQYQIKKESLDTKYGHKNNERRLFHGTHALSIDAINHRGFNRSYAGAHAAVYGKGTYFAVDPKYSALDTYSKADAQGHKHMYLALVLVGEFTKGDGTMVVPPERDPGKSADLYDSVVDDTANPTTFIIFHDVQAYPEYLIKFK
ncbi:hypothetical protein SKAU_G00320880 [Synaphobranchus kaupii]|uniref:Poly [ADP-ribose] polymerase n=1 Tax=Synaphobranchus kaupii TaxID=118154 RepID=A0A9Q1ENU3_SYNKA|nr:hypothetical protein SKAU_G00320880 [Synaphobranchus kaupii]